MARVLSPDEYPRLAGTELETVWPHLPANAAVIVVEDGPEIVGTWAVYPLVHVEGCWIAPSHRGRAGVARRLLATMRWVAQAMGAQAVNTAAIDPTVADMLLTLGAVELPGRHFALKVGGTRCQQP